MMECIMGVSRKIGQITVCQHIRSGVPTGRWYIDVPAKLSGERERRFYPNRKKAEEMAREINRRLSIAGVAAPQAVLPSLQFRKLIELLVGEAATSGRDGKQEGEQLGCRPLPAQALACLFR